MTPLPSAKARATRTKMTQTNTFQSPISNGLLEYWRGKCHGQNIPKWSDIDLMDLYDIAPNIMVRDAVDNGKEFRCRFFGSNLVRTFGYDPTGKLLGEVYKPTSVDVALNRYYTGLTAAIPTRVVGYVDLVDTQVPKTFEFIVLPLDGNSGRREHILCAFDFSYKLRDEDFDDGCQPAAWPGMEFPNAFASNVDER
jgi:hypothetical protein